MSLACVVLAALAGCVQAFVPPGLRTSQAPALQPTFSDTFETPEELESSRGWGANIGAATAAGLFGLAAAGFMVGRASLRSSRARAAPATQRQAAGICLPLTERFDPLNLGSTEAKLERYTAVEIKHGRVAMIACVGYAVPEFFKFPGCETFENGLNAFSTIPAEGIFQLVLFIGAHELLIKPRAGGMGAYDLGFGTELLVDCDPEEIERRQTVERNNGRLAMIGIMGMMWQDGTFGMTPFKYQSDNGLWGGSVDSLVANIPCCEGLCATRSPARGPGLTAMRANMPSGASGFSTGGISKRDPMRILRGEELRMSPAVPFLEYPEQLEGWVGGEKGFDPLGISNALPVYLLREAELKHGRVCMLAVIGWIATDLGVRFPAEIFQNVSTLEAHDKAVEAGYMLPFFLGIGVIELYGGWLFFSGFSMSIERDAGDFFIGKSFLPKDPAKEKEMKLKELENGRLAMLAFSGIQTAAVLTQQPWPFL